MGGPAYQDIIKKIGHMAFMQDYFNGKLSQGTFVEMVDSNHALLKNAGLSDWWIQLLRRFPSNPKGHTQQLFTELYHQQILPAMDLDDEPFNAYWTDVEKVFVHLPDRFTTIFPEEIRMAYEVSIAIKPKHIVVAGSYYAYLAVWLIKGLAKDGQMVCIDIDPDVCALAERNIKALGALDRVRIVCKDAEMVLKDEEQPIDLLVVDAYGSHTHPDPRYHGKAIYGPLIKAALPRLHKGSFVMAHNAEAGASDLAEFYQALQHASFSMLFPTTDNMGVFRI